MLERLQKYMAHCGIASRRASEEIIRQGRVTVDGEVVTQVGVKVDPDQSRIKVDGRRLKKTENKVYYLLHKPRDVTTTASDDLGRKTVLDMLPEVKKRLYPVGRLDRDSEGLVLITNDGEMAHYMTHPAFGVHKVYRAWVEGEVDPALLRKLTKEGVKVGAAKVQPHAAKLVKVLKGRSVIEVTVGEGINREVRRLFAALGHEVKKLVRIKEGPLVLRGLGKGKCRPLRDEELAALRKGMKQARIHGPDAPHSGTIVYDRQAARQGKPDPAKIGKAKGSRRGKGGKGKPAHAPQTKSAPPKKKPTKRTPPPKPQSKHPLGGKG